MKILATILIMIIALPYAYAYDIEVTLSQGDSITHTRSDRTFNITANFIDENFAVITLNGERSDKLYRRNKFSFRDNTSAVIREILYQGFAGGKKQVEIGLFLGKGSQLTEQLIREQPVNETEQTIQGNVSNAPIFENKSKTAGTAAQEEKKWLQRVWMFVMNLL